MEDELQLRSNMRPQEAYVKFEDDLLKQLPADQPEFIELLEKNGVIGGEAKKKINVRLGNKLGCAAVILAGVEKSMPESDVKFYKLLLVMKEYNHGLETLAEKIENTLDPVGTPFMCRTMHDYLRNNIDALSNLPYEDIKHDLLAQGVITSLEKQQIGFDHYSKMRRVLEIIQSSLFERESRKLKQFLRVLEESGDKLLEKAAKKLGGSKRVPDVGEATMFKIILIPVDDSRKIMCNEKYGGFFLWKGHNFEVLLPPDCADNAVSITLSAYLPSCTQNHCLASAVFKISTNVEVFKKPITVRFPHWVNIKSEKDIEKLGFLIFRKRYHNIQVPQNYLCEVQKGFFEVGESFGSVEVSEVCLICIYKRITAAHFAFAENECFKLHTDDAILRTFQAAFVTQEPLVNLEEGFAIEATAENQYLDLLILPKGHTEKWGVYCITLDNPTYLQAVVKYFADEDQIDPSIQVLKRQMVFEKSTEDAVAELKLVDAQADGKIIKFNNKRISKQSVDALDLKVLKAEYGPVFGVYKIDFPKMCSLHIIGKLSPESSKLMVDGLHGIRNESSEFSLASPTKYGYKFQKHEHIEAQIVKKPSQPREVNFYKNKVTEDSITLSWKEPNPLDMSIVGYGVEYRKAGECFKTLKNTLTCKDFTCKVTGLAANTEYEFRVAAINETGYGAFSHIAAQFTKPSQPKQLAIDKNKITETSITLSWKEPDSSDGPIGYEVEYRKGSENFEKVQESLTHGDLMCEVTGLAAHTEYEFRVAAINTAGCGPFTDVVAQFTKLDCDATANKLQSQLNTLVNLNYDAMSLSLFSQSIITRRERQIINDKCGEEKMEYLLADIIIPSLRVNVYGKYKGFLKAMEESDDSTLKSTAKNLGGSKSIPDS